MTRVILPPGAAVAPAVAAAAMPPPARGGPSFADFLAGGDGATRQLGLEQELAQLFNEFGFFPHDEPRAPAKAPDDVFQPAAPVAADGGNGSQSRPPAAAVRSLQPGAGTQPSVPASASLPGGAEAQDATESRLPPAGVLAPGLAPEVREAEAEAERRHAALPSPAAAAITGAGPRRFGPLPQPRPERPAMRQGAPRAVRPRGLAERFTFALGDRGVEIVVKTGRLPALEEDRLLEALSELLGRHGLAIGDARINGVPVVRGAFSGSI